VTIDEIKATVTMQDVLDRYGFQVNRKGFMPCPFHNEKTASLKIYRNSFYCFGCGAGNSVIDFVMLMENCSFEDAIRKLGGDEPIKFSEKRRVAGIKRNQERLAKKRQTKENQYHNLQDEWIRLDLNLRDYKPNPEDDHLHPLFVEALQKIGYQGYLLDAADESW